MSIIELSGVTKRFKDVVAVNNLSLQFNPGEVTALLGPNGAGKSTTIEMLLGLITPNQGSISVLGTSPKAAVKSGRLSAMLQDGALLEDNKVGDVVSLLGHLYGHPEQVDIVIAETKLETLANRKIRKCSGGEKQRLRLAIALLSQPEVLILDEPTVGLDPGARRKFWDIMQRQAVAGRTIIFATHYLDEAESFATRTIIMNQGKIVADGPTAEVRGSIATQHLTALVSASVWAQLENRLRACLAANAEIYFAKESVAGLHELKIHAADARRAAILLLEEPDVHNVELRNATLDDAFTALTQEGR